MPVYSKTYIAQQVLIKLSGGFVDTGFFVEERDLYPRIEQKVNSALKMQQFAMQLPSGETIPENLAMGLYENVTVVSSGMTSYAELPIMPISLPRNAGIHNVFDPNNPDNSFIPILNGQRQLLKTDTLLSNCLNQVSYWPTNRKRISFSVDLTLMGVSEVSMELVVLDISEYSSTDMLPVQADLVDKIVTELYQEYLQVTPENATVNQFTNAGQKSTP